MYHIFIGRGDDLKDRIKEVRKKFNLTQVEFGSKIGIRGNTVTNYESGLRVPSDAVILSICREFGINEEWLRTGEGEMFVKLSPAEEVATYVSDLLEDDGENPLYGIIIQIMKTYSGLSPKSQEVIRDFARQLAENIKEKGS